MTSNIQVGLSEPEHNAPKKHNSRHAHTDIFGTSDPIQPTPKKSSSGSSIKNLAEEKETDVKDNGNTQKEDKPEGTNGNEVPAPKFQRVRMPPGGHSSELW